jgi:hypothetical protein
MLVSSLIGPIARRAAVERLSELDDRRAGRLHSIVDRRKGGRLRLLLMLIRLLSPSEFPLDFV